MSGEAVKLGPFTGGINTLSDPTGLKDEELVDAINLELDLDGSLIARPPVYPLPNASGTTRMKLLGYFAFGSSQQLLGTNNSGLWYYDGAVWNFIAAAGAIQSTAMVQYEDKAWVIATQASAVAGGYWNGSAWTLVAAIPRGGSAVVHKERMYIAPGPSATGSDTSLLRFTDPANFTTSWSGANTVYVNKGDGQKLIDIIVYNDNLLMFKNDSTYVYSFDNTPLEGVIRKVHGSIGVYNKNCVVAYENSLYVLHERNIYEVTNYDFAKINAKVPFFLDGTKPSAWADPVFITILGDRLIVKYYARIYAYGLKTKAWTRWDTGTRYIGPFVAVPVRDESTAIPTYICASAVLSEANKIYGFTDGVDAVNTENITCYLKTKNYDFDLAHLYKRLFWWGADVAAKNAIVGTVTPVVVNFQVTWGMLKAYTWGAVKLNTWGQPLVGPSIVQTTVGASGGSIRKFAKFLKSLRFRQVMFELSITWDGTTITGPVRVFTLTAIVSPKETVSKSLS